MKNEKNTQKAKDANKANSEYAVFPCGNTACPLDGGGICSTCHWNPNKR